MTQNTERAAQHAFWQDLFTYLGVGGFLCMTPIYTPWGWRLILEFYSDEEHKGGNDDETSLHVD